VRRDLHFKRAQGSSEGRNLVQVGALGDEPPANVSLIR
jgi:hypothetical protein